MLLVGSILEGWPANHCTPFHRMQAGGAYVPLDPAYPAARLAFMVQDSGTTVLLTTRALSVTMQWPDSVSVIYLDEEAVGGQQPVANPPRLPKAKYGI